jgi:hypothetical protein
MLLMMKLCMHTNNGMIYDNITKAKFIRRPNRFIAESGN